MNDKVKDLLNEFEKKQHIYEEYCLAIYKLLDSVLDHRNYKHQIFYRIKRPGRLKEKILRKYKEGKIYKKLSDIEDLAAVRVIFYFESDKKRFIKDIKKELKASIKIDKHCEVLGYRADHLIATLDPARLKLSEYKKFKKLKCEIQLTSILNHAWAEIEHDWLYKDVYGFKNRSPEKYKLIKKKLEYIFNNYVNKTELEFEKIARQIKQYCTL